MYNAAHFIASPAFMKIAVNEACKMLAEANNAKPEDIKNAYRLGADKVVNNVNELVMEAAEASAKRYNELGL